MGELFKLTKKIIKCSKKSKNWLHFRRVSIYSNKKERHEERKKAAKTGKKIDHQFGGGNKVELSGILFTLGVSVAKFWLSGDERG